MTLVGVLDCNNFFVSCERLFRPDLINKPVVVLSGNDGCVVARSQEIKDNGIPMGVPYFQIKDTLQDIKATVFSSHIALYRDISRRVFEVVAREAGVIDMYSIDECFFTIESVDAEEIACKIKKKVEREVGVPITIGIAGSKTQAKYVNGTAKRTSGVAVWNSEKWSQESSSIKLGDIWGVGAGRLRQFSANNILTVNDFCDLPISTVERLFGVEGLRLRAEFQGESFFKAGLQKKAQKSVMSTRSFSETTTDLSVLNDAVAYHVHSGVEDLEKMNLMASGLRVMIYPSRYSDFSLQGASLEVRFTSPTKDLFVIRREAESLLRKCYKPEVPYKKAGIVLTGLVDSGSVSLSLFEDLREKDTSVLSEAVFAINQRLGKPLIQLGRISDVKNKWKVSNKSLSPAYTTRWSGLRTVVA
jgi:DNA polymerase V